MILLAYLKFKKNLISCLIKFLTTKTLKSRNNNEFEKITLFLLECLFFGVEFQFQDKPYSIPICPSQTS
jgi:hypothetical protein